MSHHYFKVSIEPTEGLSLEVEGEYYLDSCNEPVLEEKTIEVQQKGPHFPYCIPQWEDICIKGKDLKSYIYEAIENDGR